MADKRDCPRCGARMNQKTVLFDGTEMPPYLYQCPQCKNIEVLDA